MCIKLRLLVLLRVCVCVCMWHSMGVLYMCEGCEFLWNRKVEFSVSYCKDVETLYTRTHSLAHTRNPFRLLSLILVYHAHTRSLARSFPQPLLLLVCCTAKAIQTMRLDNFKNSYGLPERLLFDAYNKYMQAPWNCTHVNGWLCFSLR